MLSEIGSDIITEIGLLLHDSSRNTLFSLIQVNKTLHNLILPFVYRRCTLDFTVRVHDPHRRTTKAPIIRTEERLKAFLWNDSSAFVFQSVRDLIVRASNSGTPMERGESKWECLVEFVSRLSNLHHITFDCLEPVPIALLEALHRYQPSSHLHVRNWTRASCDVRVGDPYEEALARSSCLRSIEAGFLTGGPLIDLNVAAFKRVMSLAPNIESASFSSRAAGGCLVYFNEPGQLETEQREVEKFRVDLRKPKVLKKLRWDYLNQSTIAGLEKIVDFSELVELVVGPLYYDALVHIQSRDHRMFSKLKHLSFQLPTFLEYQLPEIHSIVAGLILQLPPLESLSIITSFPDIRIDILTLLDSLWSLSSLSLHEVEHTTSRRHVITPEQVDLIRAGAPILSSLEIDINRTIDQKSENAVYASLSAFPNLVRLALHYDLGLCARFNQISDEVDEIYTEIDEEFAKSVWKAVGGQKKDSKLEQFVLYVGEQNRDMGFGYPACWVLHESEESFSICVERQERDDKRDEVYLKSTKSVCPWRNAPAGTSFGL